MSSCFLDRFCGVFGGVFKEGGVYVGGGVFTMLGGVIIGSAIGWRIKGGTEDAGGPPHPLVWTALCGLFRPSCEGALPDHRVCSGRNPDCDGLFELGGVGASEDL